MRSTCPKLDQNATNTKSYTSMPGATAQMAPYFQLCYLNHVFLIWDDFMSLTKLSLVYNPEVLYSSTSCFFFFSANVSQLHKMTYRNLITSSLFHTETPEDHRNHRGRIHEPFMFESFMSLMLTPYGYGQCYQVLLASRSLAKDPNLLSHISRSISIQLLSRTRSDRGSLSGVSPVIFP